MPTKTQDSKEYASSFLSPIRNRRFLFLKAIQSVFIFLLVLWISVADAQPRAPKMPGEILVKYKGKAALSLKSNLSEDAENQQMNAASGSPNTSSANRHQAKSLQEIDERFGLLEIRSLDRKEQRQSSLSSKYATPTDQKSPPSPSQSWRLLPGRVKSSSNLGGVSGNGQRGWDGGENELEK